MLHAGLPHAGVSVSSLLSCWYLNTNNSTELNYFILLNRVNFLKPFLKGKILRSSERGVNSILTTILRF